MKKSWILALAAAATLAACGGGDDDTPPVTEQVPPSASASAAGFIDYLRQLVTASADMTARVWDSRSGRRRCSRLRAILA